MPATGDGQVICSGKGEPVTQVQQLEHRLQLVVTIGSLPQDVEEQVYLGRGRQGQFAQLFHHHDQSDFRPGQAHPDGQVGLVIDVLDVPAVLIDAARRPAKGSRRRLAPHPEPHGRHRDIDADGLAQQVVGTARTDRRLVRYVYRDRLTITLDTRHAHPQRTQQVDPVYVPGLVPVDGETAALTTGGNAELADQRP